MYLLGHFGIAYLTATISSRFTRENYSIPLVLVASVLPDIDFLFSPYLVHRGPTHSIITITIIFLPVYLYFRKGLPYYFALLSHLIGDYVTAYGLQLFWPVTEKWYRASHILRGMDQVGVEFGLFTLMLIHITYIRIYKKKN
jgi:membrane-bound metal-dependent hydrolase YbcI (DUF457 family)